MVAHDQQDFRIVLFKERHRRHCHVSGEGNPGYRLRFEIAAPQDQHTLSSASFTMPQCGQSQLGPRIFGSFRIRRRQSTQAKAMPKRTRRRRAPGRSSSTADEVPGAR
jgi:hypothetical protein